MERLSKVAIDSIEGSVSVQASVRHILNTCTEERALIVLCHEMAEFRTEAEQIIILNTSGDAGVLRKKVNNIINDVSRITSEVTGKSIICTSRKGGYKFEAKDRVKRATLKPLPFVEEEEPVEDVDIEDRVGDDIASMCNTFPIAVMTEMLRRYSPREFMEIAKQAKERIDIPF